MAESKHSFSISFSHFRKEKIEVEMGLIGQMSRLVKGNLERFFFWWGTLVTRHPYKDSTFLLASKIYSNYIIKLISLPLFNSYCFYHRQTNVRIYLYPRMATRQGWTNMQSVSYANLQNYNFALCKLYVLHYSAICIILRFAFSSTENSNTEVGYIPIARHHWSQ